VAMRSCPPSGSVHTETDATPFHSDKLPSSLPVSPSHTTARQSRDAETTRGWLPSVEPLMHARSLMVATWPIRVWRIEPACRSAQKR
jgi:hypothetical protein